MGSGEEGRLLICTFGSMPAADLIELAASMQRQFADHPVAATDLDGLRQVTDKRSYDDDRQPPKLSYDLALLDVPVETVVAVLSWLGGTASRQAGEQAVKAAADLLGKWMRSRRGRTGDATQVAYILGPHGEVLKKVQVRPQAPAPRRTTRRRR
jgi:hypothetical protein